MAFLNQRFPECISIGAVGGHGCFDTAIVQLASGAESAIQRWLRARGRWNISNGVKYATEEGDLVDDPDLHDMARAFFYMTRGRLHHFRFKDWGDYVCSREASRVLELTSTTFQAYKVYGDDPSFEYLRKLTRLIAGMSVWIGGTPAALGVDYTVNVDTGILTIASSPDPATVEILSEFDVPCRFDTDSYQPELMFRRADGRVLMNWDDIPIIEVRE